MRKPGKNITKARAAVEKRPYLLNDAVPLLQKVKYVKFDETVEVTLRLGVDGMPTDLVVRGVTPTGDAAENFSIGDGKASWVSTVDKGGAPYASPAYYLPQGGPFLGTAPQIDALLTAGNAGMALLPSGKATFDKVASLDVDGAQGTKHVDLILLKGTSQSPQPVWVENGKFFDSSCSGSLRRRRSTGSMFSATASSSTADSSAKIPLASPGARM